MTSKQLTEIKLGKEDKFVENSRKFQITSGKKYTISTRVKGTKGEQFCGYFGVVILNKNGREITRRISWLNDFSGKKNIVKVIFEAPQESSEAVCIYRLNYEVPVKSSCQYYLVPINQISWKESADELKENYCLTSDYSIPKLKELSHEEEFSLERNLVWIFAAPRSGTSWLGTQLLSFQTLSLNEPQIGLHIGIRQPRIRDRIVRQIDLFKNEPDYFFSKQYMDTWKFYIRKLVLNRIFAQFQILSTKIIIKEPNGVMGADIITQCLPNSKIIFLARDGRDTIDSILDAFQKDSWATKEYGYTPISQERRFSEIKYQADLWVKLMKIINDAFNKHSKDLRLLVKYEDLRKNTIEELKKIYKFIDIDIPKKELENIVEKYSFEKIPEDLKGSGKVTRSATPGKWRKNFTAEEIKIMDEIIGKSLQKLGYSNEPNKR